MEGDNEFQGKCSSGNYFIDPPRKEIKKKKSKRKGKVDGGGNDPVDLTKFAEKIKKGITLTEIYGYEDIEPMFNDGGSAQLRATQVDLKKEDDAMFVGRDFCRGKISR